MSDDKTPWWVKLIGQVLAFVVLVLLARFGIWGWEQLGALAWFEFPTPSSAQAWGFAVIYGLVKA